MTESFDNFVRTLGNYIPSLLGAVVLLLVGIGLAWVLRWLILRLGSGIDRLYHRFGLGSNLSLRWPVSRIISGIVFWLTILFFAAAAAEVLSLPGLTEWLNKLIAFLPAVLVTLLIIVVGILLGDYVRDYVRVSAASIGLEQTELLAALARLIILIIAVILAFQHLGLDVGVVEQIMVIAVAAFFAAIALSFGLGASLTVTNIISTHYVRKLYRIGQRIRINDTEGSILEITPTAVILDTAEGRIVIPSKSFNENASILLDEDTNDET
ncbi:MAG: mechanosensitive ion channel [Gammaproteobacteria bacterium]|nr:mechanosensitive ion channel [Gammaproteobacteria bacterium]